MIGAAISLAERGLVPDALIRFGIRRFCAERLRMGNRPAWNEPEPTLDQIVADLRTQPIALAVDEANQQHYEAPTEFFLRALGPRLKYSCCWFEKPTDSLAQAEEAMLDLTCQRAELADGMQLLDLGCGWGSLTLWLLEQYPHARVLAVSNSRTQRQFIEAQAAERGYASRLEVQTRDMRVFSTERRFDRILSIEMFEHMRNYQELLARISGWLAPGGKLFTHVFAHRQLCYPFETAGESNWMGRHFFTGGIMPSEALLGQFQRELAVEQQWWVSGKHYQLTSEAWLRRTDSARRELLPLFAEPPGESAAIRLQRWRIFFLACAELFGFGGGEQWGVSHARWAIASRK